MIANIGKVSKLIIENHLTVFGYVSCFDVCLVEKFYWNIFSSETR